MPTTRPRYQAMDTGDVREMLDAAQARWPQIGDRELLLIELARRGASVVREQEERDARADERRRAAQRQAFLEVRDRVDVDVLLSEDAWR